VYNLGEISPSYMFEEMSFYSPVQSNGDQTSFRAKYKTEVRDFHISIYRCAETGSFTKSVSLAMSVHLLMVSMNCKRSDI
jgi:hypothetical protein